MLDKLNCARYFSHPDERKTVIQLQALTQFQQWMDPLLWKLERDK